MSIWFIHWVTALLLRAEIAGKVVKGQMGQDRSGVPALSPHDSAWRAKRVLL